jgi:hypothetical protein
VGSREPLAWGTCGGLTTLRISCGRNARGSEFHAPLSATGGQLRGRTLAGRARQLHALVRPHGRRSGQQPIRIRRRPGIFPVRLTL